MDSTSIADTLDTMQTSLFKLKDKVAFLPEGEEKKDLSIAVKRLEAEYSAYFDKYFPL